MKTIESDILTLVNCELEVIDAILNRTDNLSKLLNAKIPQNWSEFGTSVFEYVREKVSNNPETASWWTYLPILKEEKTLIGSCGYKGPPDKEGMVEIGYEIAKTYRNKGYATEIVRMLLGNAYETGKVTKVQAHTLAEENASVHVLKKSGFIFDEDLTIGDEKVWKWLLVIQSSPNKVS